jgi:hypothetical protein
MMRSGDAALIFFGRDLGVKLLVKESLEKPLSLLLESSIRSVGMWPVRQRSREVL